MPLFVPTFKLFAADGITLVYHFPVVQTINAPQSVKKSYIVETPRGKGGILIPGPDSIWDLEFKFILFGIDYTDLTSKISALEAAVTLHTPFVFTYDTAIASTQSYNVKRIEPIKYADSLRWNFQEITIRLKANIW